MEPLFGIVIGVLFIIFRERICTLLQIFFEKFPKYEDGVKALNINFSIRPVFIFALGVLLIFVSIIGVIASFK